MTTETNTTAAGAAASHPDTPGQAPIAAIEVSPDGGQDVDYMTIEGMRGQEYSVGIFVFMLIGVFVFIMIIAQFMRTARRSRSMRRGELILFWWIILGTLGAVFFGGLQLLQGRLF